MLQTKPLAAKLSEPVPPDICKYGIPPDTPQKAAYNMIAIPRPALADVSFIAQPAQAGASFVPQPAHADVTSTG